MTNPTQPSQQVPVAELPALVEFAAAYLDGVMEGENQEIRGKWQTIRKYLAQSASAEQLMIEKRISVTPEFEGGFIAAVYMEEAEPIASGYGETPREAIDDALSKGNC